MAFIVNYNAMQTINKYKTANDACFEVAKRLAELSKYVKEYGINYIYFEENASSAVSKTLADELTFFL